MHTVGEFRRAARGWRAGYVTLLIAVAAALPVAAQDAEEEARAKAAAAQREAAARARALQALQEAKEKAAEEKAAEATEDGEEGATSEETDEAAETAEDSEDTAEAGEEKAEATDDAAEAAGDSEDTAETGEEEAGETEAAKKREKLEAAVEGLSPKARKEIMERIRIGGGEVIIRGGAEGAAEATAPEAAPADSGDAASAELESEAARAVTGEAEAAEAKEPKPPMFYMRDGTRLAGFPAVERLEVETAYGPLVIPVAEITRIRFARARKEELDQRIAKLIERLGHEEYDLREQAMTELRAVGAPAVEPLQAALETTEDEEVRTRAERLIGELEQEIIEPDEENIHMVPVQGDEDEIVTLQFTARGRVLQDSFTVETRYGKLDFHRQDIISIVFSEPMVQTRSYTVPGDRIAGQDRWLDTETELADGQAFEVKASGSIKMPAFGRKSCGPEGTSEAPSMFQSLPAGALVGRFGEEGDPFLVGASYEGEAPGGATLQLALALDGPNAEGQYEVEIVVHEDEEG